LLGAISMASPVDKQTDIPINKQYDEEFVLTQPYEPFVDDMIFKSSSSLLQENTKHEDYGVAPLTQVSPNKRKLKKTKDEQLEITKLPKQKKQKHLEIQTVRDVSQDDNLSDLVLTNYYHGIEQKLPPRDFRGILFTDKKKNQSLIVYIQHRSGPITPELLVVFNLSANLQKLINKNKSVYLQSISLLQVFVSLCDPKSIGLQLDQTETFKEKHWKECFAELEQIFVSWNKKVVDVSFCL
jgi:hypothetical protein